MEEQHDIIVITHGHLELTINCINSIYKHTIAPFHLIVMDDSTPDMNEGTDMTLEWFKRFQRTHSNITFVHSKVPYKSSLQIFKKAFEYCKTPFVTVVVNSLTVEPEWDIAALQIMRGTPQIGMLGFKCLRMGTELIESAGLGVSSEGATLSDVGRGQAGHRFSKVYECDAVQWAFVMLRLEAVKPNLGADVYFGFKGWEEFETCYTMRKAGWKIYYCGAGVGYHKTLGTRQAATLEDVIQNMRNRETFAKRWGFWNNYHRINPAVQEFFPHMRARDMDVLPVLSVDPVGLALRVQNFEQGTETQKEVTIEIHKQHGGR